MSLSNLPTLDAFLNGLMALFLAAGYLAIRKGRRSAHKRLMLTAFVSSSLIPTSYLYYHAHVGSVTFTGNGIARPVYFAILISHSILAAAIVPMIMITLARGLSSASTNTEELRGGLCRCGSMSL